MGFYIVRKKHGVPSYKISMDRSPYIRKMNGEIYQLLAPRSNPDYDPTIVSSSSSHNSNAQDIVNLVYGDVDVIDTKPKHKTAMKYATIDEEAVARFKRKMELVSDGDLEQRLTAISSEASANDGTAINLSDSMMKKSDMGGEIARLEKGIQEAIQGEEGL